MSDIWYQNEDNKSTVSSISETNDEKIDLALIETIRSEDNLFRLIVSSFCPEIIGQQLIKSALVLALFCGVHKTDRQSKGLSVRAQIHVLLFGDHGSNKDLFLKAVHSMSPNAHYICGNTSNRNSLTTSSKRSQSKEIVEKGCLQSEEMAICCFDEFERMDGTQHQIVEEVMEYQTLTHSSKTCFWKEVSANTSVVAAVNPINGYYDWTQNVWQNTRLRKSLLSKFDLMFVLFDSPDEEIDSKTSKQILENRKCQNNDLKSSQRLNSFSQTSTSQTINCQLMAKLIVSQNEELDLIPHECLKKYISYAQKYVNPVLTVEAINTLETFYSGLEATAIRRSQTRVIESLFRLTEARARLELRSEATKEDASDVIDIVSNSLDILFKVPNGGFAGLPLNKRISFRTSKKSQNAKNLLKALKMFSEQNQRKEFTFEEIVEICGQFEIPFDSKDEISVAVERLNEQTFLLKTKSNYKLI